jgi:hypothetical protein
MLPVSGSIRGVLLEQAPDHGTLLERPFVFLFGKEVFLGFPFAHFPTAGNIDT